MPGADETGLAEVLAALHQAGVEGAVELESGPTRLVGGRSADIFRFRLTAGLTALGDGRDLVLRLLPPGAGSIGEGEMQREVAGLGFPAPKVLHIGVLEHDPCRAYIIMDAVDGESLFDSVGARRSFREVPARLAELMLDLHRLDPAPVRRSLERIGAVARQNAQARALADIDASFRAIGHPADEQLRRWLEQHQPAPENQVVCHGDLHALNVLVDGTATAVIDWELAALGDAAYDVARTKLLLQAVPMAISKPIRPLVQRLGRGGARRFQTEYTRRSPIDAARLTWHEVLHTTRMVGLLLSEGAAVGPGERVLDAWRPTLPFLRSSVQRLTGVAIER
jgi:aminoglycoside phosphotransferase (APT) family kinase protein